MSWSASAGASFLFGKNLVQGLQGASRVQCPCSNGDHKPGIRSSLFSLQSCTISSDARRLNMKIELAADSVFFPQSGSSVFPKRTPPHVIKPASNLAFIWTTQDTRHNCLRTQVILDQNLPRRFISNIRLWWSVNSYPDHIDSFRFQYAF